MKFQKTIIYVSNVAESLAFFEKAFGLPTRVSYGAGYGEVETGEGVSLSFASYEAGQSHLPEGYTAGSSVAMNVEISLVDENVEAAFKRAVEAGATPLQEPNRKPWGQTASFLRCPDGTFIDLSSPVAR